MSGKIGESSTQHFRILCDRGILTLFLFVLALHVFFVAHAIDPKPSDVEADDTLFRHGGLAVSM